MVAKDGNRAVSFPLGHQRMHGLRKDSFERFLSNPRDSVLWLDGAGDSMCRVTGINAGRTPLAAGTSSQIDGNRPALVVLRRLPRAPHLSTAAHTRSQERSAGSQAEGPSADWFSHSSPFEAPLLPELLPLQRP